MSNNNGNATRQVPYLVVGSGVAGLFFALKAAHSGKVLLITKATRQESNTRWAQGGIAGVFGSEDSFEKHVQDTLIAGDGLCNEAVVRMVVTDGPTRIRELMDYGTHFDRAQDGTLELAREGGHSANRILHSHDATGAEISRALIEACAKHPNIEIVEHLFAVDLITQHHLGMYVNRGTPNIECYGVYALDLRTRHMVTVLAKVTVLASGGAGNVYFTTTNPNVATGDGVAMAHRAKARISNMEFYQFHPTALYDPTGARPAFLITEALRGKGAYLRNSFSKERFMHNYDKRLELAPRDIVARSIDSEMKTSGTEYAYLDATHIPKADLLHEFPTIYERLLQRGIDMTKDMIPVVPAAHYMCGGIEVDKDGRTSIHNLFAIGECSCTGLHGANRLASNSLLEALVYGHNAAQAATAVALQNDYKIEVPPWNDHELTSPDEWVLIGHNLREVQQLMSNYVGIVRTNLRLERAWRRLRLIHEETESFYQRTKISPELCELRNIIACAYLIVKSAFIRKESRGLHYNTDYPVHQNRVYDTVL